MPLAETLLLGIYCSHRIAEGTRAMQAVVILIGGLISIVVGILMIIFSVFPILVAILMGFLTMVWGIIAVVLYWL